MARTDSGEPSPVSRLGLLDHLGGEQATLVGHSQGGFLSLRAALRAPERVKALVLIDTVAAARPPETLAPMSGIRDRFRVDRANSFHFAGLAPRCWPWRLQTTRGYSGSRHGRYRPIRAMARDIRLNSRQPN
jgi:pimeloyl-ACP methyl ester carboxylesterase